MSMLTDRITEVTVATMRIHRPRRLHGEPQMEECQAGCKYPPGSSYEHIAAHVAQQLAEALRPDRHTVAMAIRKSAGGSYTWEKLAEAAIEACGWS